MLKRSLILNTAILCFQSCIAFSQTPIASFNLPEEVCEGENFIVQNNSVDAATYLWDFCPDDFEEEPNIETYFSSSLLKTVNNITIYQDSFDAEKFVFIPSGDEKEVYRYKTKNDFSDMPVLEPIFGSMLPLSRPIDIDIIKIGNSYFAYLIDFNDNKLYEVTFGTQLSNDPIKIKDLGDFTSLNGPISIKAVQDKGLLKLIVLNYNTNHLTLITKNSSGNFVSENINSEYTRGSGIDIIRYNSKWIVSVGYTSSGLVKFFDFGDVLTPSGSSFNYYLPGISKAGNVKLVAQSGELNAFVQSNSGSFSRINFGESYNTTPSFHDYGNLDILNNNTRGFDMVKNSRSEWYALMVQLNQDINKISFVNNCGAGTGLSRHLNPTINYSDSGAKEINLTAYDEDGNSSSITKSIMVNSTQAPKINFSIDESRCENNANTFLSNSPDDASLTSLTWDFGDGTTATGTEATHQYTSPGTYKVRLTVESDGGCGNFIEKEVNIYPAPDPEFSFPAGVLCTNGAITFENSTPGEYNDDVTWTWDFGDGTTSAEKEPSHIYATGGTKTVTLKASIPGCEATVSHELEVIPGPSVDFNASNLCLGEEVQFSNLSTGSSITDYAWDFGNGEASTAENPTVTYAAAGTYEVSLTVNNTSGCSNTLTKSIVIHSLPEVDFDHALVCSGSPTPFEDRSTVEDGSISSWLWNFGDGTTSTEKNPVHIFAEPGTYEVKLIVSSSWGCIDSTKQTVLVKSSPKANFVVERGCPGTTSRFIDTSTIPEGDQIVKRVWVINSASFFSENPEIKFSLPGTYSATLTVTSSNGCQSSITREVIIDPLPAPDFTFTNSCVGELTAFTDLSQAFGDDEIIDWQWQFGNMAISNDQHPEVSFTNAGDVPVTLTVTTDRGCAVSIHKTVTISALPSAAFTTQTNLGAPPLRVNFKNNTSGAVSYQWWFGDPDNSTSTEENPAFVYTTLGEYEAKLIATNAAGCTDTASMMIKTLIPKLEVALEQLNTFNTSGDLQLVLKITNKGSIRIEDMDITLDLGGQLKVKEHFSGSIAAGESVNYPLSFEILKENMVRVPYVCASLSIVNTEYSEENLEDNSACKDIAKEFLLLTPFPNPVNGTFYVNFVMPEKAPVRLLITDMLGETVVDKALPDAKVGYNSFDFDFSSLTAGMYVIKVIHGGQTHLRKVVVR